jgi:hypothetical protein
MPQWRSISGCDQRGISAFDPCEETATMANGPRWNNPNTANQTVNAAMKRRMHKARMREMRLRQEEAARLALAEINAARNAALPWPVRAIGATLDFIFRRPSPGVRKSPADNLVLGKPRG